MSLISENALKQMRNLHKNRIYISIQPGLCADYKYILSFDPDLSMTYVQNVYEDISIMLHTQYVDILQDIIIDYKRSIIDQKFYIASNIAASKVCRCGLSFS